MPRKAGTPSYRQRDSQALVTLTDAVSQRRRDYHLGDYGTPRSREQYHRLIAEWEAAGRRFPAAFIEDPGAADPHALTIAEVVRDFYRWAEQSYDEGEYRSFVVLLRLLLKFYGRTPAAEFGPKKLRLLREEMIRGDRTEKPPRRPWSRKYINQQVQRIRRVFKWAAAQELVPVTVHQALCTLEPLKRGRTSAREHPRVGPAPSDMVDAVRPFLSKPVRGLVELQLLTGARAGELIELRVCDVEIDRQTGVWSYWPLRHKNAHREHERVIYFGPRAQDILQPFLTDRDETDYLFSPTEAEEDRREERHAKRTTPLSCGNRPGTNVVEIPERSPGEQYTTNAYRRAIEYACRYAFPPPPELARRKEEKVKDWHARLKKERKWEALKAWYREHRFHPHQLRHNAATNLRREFGLEAAQLTLGHASAIVTDAVYAERDRTKVIEIMRRIG